MGHSEPLHVGLLLGDAPGLAQEGEPTVKITLVGELHPDQAEGLAFLPPGADAAGHGQRLLRHPPAFRVPAFQVQDLGLSLIHI